MRNKLVGVISTLVMVLLLATPVMAVDVQVNGNSITKLASPVLQDGTTLVDSVTLSRVLGAKLNTGDNKVEFQKNGHVLKLNANNLIASLDGKDIKILCAPQVSGDRLMVPLRPIAEALGATVTWQQDSQTAGIQFMEQKQDLTSEQMLAKSSELIQDFNTYRTTGNLTTSIKTKTSGMDVPQVPEIKMDVDVDSYYQKDPLMFYIIEGLSMSGIPDTPAELQNMKIEVLINEKGMYMNMPPNGWVRTPMEGIDISSIMEMYNSQDPTVIMKQFKEFGYITSFSEDTTINGTDYAVINVLVDQDKFTGQFEKILESMPAVPQGQAELKDVFKNTQFDLFYSFYIDKENLLTRFTDMDGSISMNIANPENSAEKVNMEIKIQGRMETSDFDVPFTAPDVSSAKDITEITPPDTVLEN